MPAPDALIRDHARADARAAALRADALRRESDAKYLAGDMAGALHLLAAAREFDAVCNGHCKAAAISGT